MNYCKNCLEPDTRPRSVFSSKGFCSACSYKKKQSKLSEKKRIKLFTKILKKFKSHKKYDCVIGVSGGKDSTRQALWVRDKFKVNPLLVCCTYPPDQITKAGHENLSNLINLGFDVIVSGPSPVFWKKILKEGFFKGNYLRGPEIALFSSVPQIAVKYGIRLIIWGESPGYLYYLTKHATFPKIYVGTMEAEIITTHENVDILDRKVQKKGKLCQQIKELIPYRIPFMF